MNDVSEQHKGNEEPGFQVIEAATGRWCLRSSNGSVNLEFRYPKYRRLYNAVRSAAFNDCICSCLGYVTDWCILHLFSLENAFVLLNSTDLLNVFNDSNEEALMVWEFGCQRRL